MCFCKSSLESLKNLCVKRETEFVCSLMELSLTGNVTYCPAVPALHVRLSREALVNTKSDNNNAVKLSSEDFPGW